LGDKNSTGDSSPVYCAAPDESGFVVRPWVQYSAARTVSPSDEARFIGRNRIARRLHRRAGVREPFGTAGYRRPGRQHRHTTTCAQAMRLPPTLRPADISVGQSRTAGQTGDEVAARACANHSARRDTGSRAGNGTHRLARSGVLLYTARISR